jgi:hypothetical protein
VGADLSFFLRKVIVDSFEGENRGNAAGGGEGEQDSPAGGEEGKGRHKVMEEAEYRLGFAIRDLPAGTGKEKWLNPLGMFALSGLFLFFWNSFVLTCLVLLQQSSRLITNVCVNCSPRFDRALDFLYLDYKPPHPVDVLITPEILSKYQRMFAFILRLMRGY